LHESPLSTGGDFFVGGGIGVDGDNVPCVEEVGKVAETAEGDVDYVVGAAGATFDPDWEGELVCVELG